MNCKIERSVTYQQGNYLTYGFCLASGGRKREEGFSVRATSTGKAPKYCVLTSPVATPKAPTGRLPPEGGISTTSLMLVSVRLSQLEKMCPCARLVMKEETMTALKAMVFAGRYVNRCREYVRALKSYVSHQRGVSGDC